MKGLKKAVGDYSRWTKGTAEIWYDSSTNEVWCDTHGSNQSWNEYQSKTIKLIEKKSSMAAQWDKTSMDEIKKRIKNLD